MVVLRTCVSKLIHYPPLLKKESALHTERYGGSCVSMLCALLASSAAAAGDMDLSLLPISLPATKGGRCLDGSMAGYYYRQGTADTFVIYLKGGGACARAGLPLAVACETCSHTRALFALPAARCLPLQGHATTRPHA